jgi:hypothetical protein
MTTVARAAPAVIDPPPIHVTRAGMGYPMDYGGGMDDAWHFAWGCLRRGGWIDAALLAAYVAGQADIEVSSARALLRQAVRRGVLEVRHRLRGTPLRVRAEYRAGGRS